MDLSVVIPAYNEGLSIRDTLHELVASIRSLNISFEVIVVNDGSKDNTLAEAESCARDLKEVKVISHMPNRGASRALLRGLAICKGDIITHNGADLPLHPSDTKVIVDEIRRGADVVVIERKNREAYGIVRKVISWSNIMLLKAAFRSPVRDHNFTQGYRRSVLQQVKVQTNGISTLTPELIIKAHRLGFKVVAVTCDYQERKRGESSVKFRDLVHAGTQLSELWLSMRKGQQGGNRVVPDDGAS